jgi:methanogenic corrinoid protein MtbC1
MMSVSHGLCERCEQSHARPSDPPARALEVARFFTQFIRDTFYECLPAPTEVIEQSRALGIQPLDLLLGIAQPTLYAVGREFAAGRVSWALEHKLSSLVEGVLLEFETSRRTQENAPRVLLMTTPGDLHDLGVRTFALALTEVGLNTDVLLQAEESDLTDALTRQRYLCVGWTISMRNQLTLAIEGLEAAKRQQPRILTALGGCVTKVSPMRFAPFDVISDPTRSRKTASEIAEAIRTRGTRRETSAHSPPSLVQGEQP